MKLYDQLYQHFYAIQLDPKKRIYLKGDGACSSKSFADYIKTRTKKALLENFGGWLCDAAMYPIADDHGAMEEILKVYKCKFKNARMVRINRMTEVSDVEFDGDAKFFCVIGIKDDRRVALCKIRTKSIDNDPEAGYEFVWNGTDYPPGLNGSYGSRLWVERGYDYFMGKFKLLADLAEKHGVSSLAIIPAN